MMSKKAFVTQEGLEKLQEELKHLKTVRRREIAEAIKSAKDQGDLSENAEYVAAKEAHHHLEQRIVEIEETLRNAEVIKKGNNHSEVGVGGTVMVEIAGSSKTFTIVGSNEADPTMGMISHESPLGTAILGKRSGDVVHMRTPNNGTQEIKILKVG